MTKRNLLLVSLFLVFGISTMATTALAQTQWVGGFATLADGRAEGLAEETGTYIFTYYGTGSVASLQYFTVTYNAPIVAGSAFLVCTGTAPSPFVASTCAGVTATIISTYVVKVTFNSALSFAGNTYSNMTLTVRVNATSPFPCGTNVTAAGHPFKVGNTNYTLGMTNVDVAFPVLAVNCSPNLSLVIAAKDREVEHANGVEGEVLNCIGAKDLKPYTDSFCINVDEEFANALTSYSYELASDPDAVNGTTFTIALSSVPAALTIKSPTVTYCGSFASSDPNNCTLGGTYTPTLTVSWGPISCVPDSGSAPPTQTCTQTFTVLTEDAGNKENMDICYEMKSGPLPTGYVQIYADVQKGPTTAGSIPLFNGSWELTPPGLSVVDFDSCQTVLLYPFVTSNYGYDTGIAVANTTLDPFCIAPPALGFPDLRDTYCRGSAVPQNGSCFFYLYGATGGVGSPGALIGVFNTGTINAGTVDAFFLSSVQAVNAAYAIAVCEFDNAHGFANVQYGTAGFYSTFSYDYLALVLPNPAFYYRSPGGDDLGESADAPIFLNRMLQRLLTGIHR
jgi:hypothetical protein